MARSRLRRVSGARKALLRSLVTALFQYGRITTTESKAKELRHVADKMISLAKRGDLHARRQAEAFIMDKAVTKKLFDETAKKYTERNGGYTRVLNLKLVSVTMHRRQLSSSLTEIRRNAPEGAFFNGEIKERTAEMKKRMKDAN